MRTFRDYLIALRRYPAGLWPWLRRTRPVAVLVTGIGAAILVGTLFGTRRSAELQYTAVTLEGLGILLVVRGLIRLGDAFGQEPIRLRLKDWWRDRPKLFKNVIIAAGTAALAAVGARGKAIVRRYPPPDASVEERIEAVEFNVKEVDKAVGELESRVDSEVAGLKRAIDAEAEGRRSGDTHLEERLAEMAVGDWDFELVGVIWLAFGLLLSSVVVQ